MASNLHLDEHLVAQAMKWGGHKTKRAAMLAAVDYYVGELKLRRLNKDVKQAGDSPSTRRKLKRG